jgi:hypothetical protein
MKKTKEINVLRRKRRLFEVVCQCLIGLYNDDAIMIFAR